MIFGSGRVISHIAVSWEYTGFGAPDIPASAAGLASKVGVDFPAQADLVRLEGLTYLCRVSSDWNIFEICGPVRQIYAVVSL